MNEADRTALPLSGTGPGSTYCRPNPLSEAALRASETAPAGLGVPCPDCDAIGDTRPPRDGCTPPAGATSAPMQSEAETRELARTGSLAATLASQRAHIELLLELGDELAKRYDAENRLLENKGVPISDALPAVHATLTAARRWRQQSEHLRSGAYASSCGDLSPQVRDALTKLAQAARPLAGTFHAKRNAQRVLDAAEEREEHEVLDEKRELVVCAFSRNNDDEPTVRLVARWMPGEERWRGTVQGNSVRHGWRDAERLPFLLELTLIDGLAVEAIREIEARRFARAGGAA